MNYEKNIQYQYCISEHNDLMMDISEICYSFVEDVSKHMKQMDIQYRTIKVKIVFIWILSLVLSQNYWLHLK